MKQNNYTHGMSLSQEKTNTFLVAVRVPSISNKAITPDFREIETDHSTHSL